MKVLSVLLIFGQSDLEQVSTAKATATNASEASNQPAPIQKLRHSENKCDRSRTRGETCEMRQVWLHAKFSIEREYWLVFFLAKPIFGHELNLWDGKTGLNDNWEQKSESDVVEIKYTEQGICISDIYVMRELSRHNLLHTTYCVTYARFPCFHAVSRNFVPCIRASFGFRSLSWMTTFRKPTLVSFSDSTQRLFAVQKTGSPSFRHLLFSMFRID